MLLADQLDTIRTERQQIREMTRLLEQQMWHQSTCLLFQTDAHNYKIIGILKQLKFGLSLRHVSIQTRTIIRELFRA